MPRTRTEQLSGVSPVPRRTAGSHHSLPAGLAWAAYTKWACYLHAQPGNTSYPHIALPISCSKSWVLRSKHDTAIFDAVLKHFDVCLIGQRWGHQSALASCVQGKDGTMEDEDQNWDTEGRKRQAVLNFSHCKERPLRLLHHLQTYWVWSQEPGSASQLCWQELSEPG